MYVLGHRVWRLEIKWRGGTKYRCFKSANVVVRALRTTENQLEGRAVRRWERIGGGFRFLEI